MKYMNNIINRIILQDKATIVNRKVVIENITKVINHYKLNKIDDSFLNQYINYIYSTKLVLTNVLSTEEDKKSSSTSDDYNPEEKPNKLINERNKSRYNLNKFFTNQSMFIKNYKKIILQDAKDTETLDDKKDEKRDDKKDDKQEDEFQKIILKVYKDKTFQFIDDDSGDRVQSKESINILDKYVYRNLNQIMATRKKQEQETASTSTIAIENAKKYISGFSNFKEYVNQINDNKLKEFLKKSKVFIDQHYKNDRFDQETKNQYYSLVATIIIYISIKNNIIRENESKEEKEKADRDFESNKEVYEYWYDKGLTINTEENNYNVHNVCTFSIVYSIYKENKLNSSEIIRGQQTLEYIKKYLKDDDNTKTLTTQNYTLNDIIEAWTKHQKRIEIFNTYKISKHDYLQIFKVDAEKNLNNIPILKNNTDVQEVMNVLNDPTKFKFNKRFLELAN